MKGVDPTATPKEFTLNHRAAHGLVADGGVLVDGRDVRTYQTPTVAVVSAVATVSETDATELDPLADTIAPGALNRMVQQWLDEEQTDASVSFDYCGCSVTVCGDGELIVRDDG